jgi:hypothetical protein
MAGPLMAGPLMAGPLMARPLMAGGLVAGSVLGGVALGSPAAGADACVADGAAAVRIATPAPALGDTIEITGSGWCHPEDGGSRIAIKIDQGAYSRPDSTVHANRSIWAIVDADDADGSFTTTLELPDGTEATSTPVFTEEAHTLQLLTGSLKPGDVIRSVISPAFTVGGADPDPDPEPDPDPDGDVCEPTTDQAQVDLATTTATLGGTLRVSGTGWCHPTDGGSRIGIKIDDGAISHLDTAVHANQTIWAIVDASPTDGTFDVEVPLPDGTAATSAPALTTGEHTLRFLTGSLVAGDTGRSVRSDPFVIGRYRPNGAPDPLNPASLRAGTKHDVRATRTGRRLVVDLPQSAAGDWVYATVYAADGSPREVSPRWHRLDDELRLDLSLRGADLSGRGRLVVQSGDQGDVGALVGWDGVGFGQAPTTDEPDVPDVPDDESDDSSGIDPPSTSGTPSGAGSPSDLTSGAATGTTGAATTSAGLVAPEPPVASFADLDPADHGSVRGEVADGVLRLTVRDAEPGATLFVTVYAPDVLVPAGWVTLDRRRSVEVDLSAWPAGYVGVTAQDPDGELRGWAAVALTGAAEQQTQPIAAPAPAAAPAAAAPVEITLASSGPSWLTATDGLLLAAGSLVLASASMLSTRRKVTP